MSLQIGLKGGLGNQLFQFAHGINQSIKYDLPISFFWEQIHSQENTPREFELNFLNIELNKGYEVENNLELGIKIVPKNNDEKRKIFKEIHIQDKFFFNEDLKINPKRENIIKGYWQSELFFTEYKNEIIKYINNMIIPLRQNHEINDERIAAIHLRFGDYYYSSSANKVHGVITRKYLHEAIKLFTYFGINSFNVYTESTDLAETYVKEYGQDLDFKLMPIRTAILDLSDLSGYSSIIGSNSSYSWWASFLGHPYKKVVLPRDWFTKEKQISNSTVDLFKPEWITIGC